VTVGEARMGGGEAPRAARAALGACWGARSAGREALGAWWERLGQARDARGRVREERAARSESLRGGRDARLTCDDALGPIKVFVITMRRSS
jgi:hypothetical protein